MPYSQTKSGHPKQWLGSLGWTPQRWATKYINIYTLSTVIKATLLISFGEKNNQILELVIWIRLKTSSMYKICACDSLGKILMVHWITCSLTQQFISHFWWLSLKLKNFAFLLLAWMCFSEFNIWSRLLCYLIFAQCYQPSHMLWCK